MLADSIKAAALIPFLYACASVDIKGGAVDSACSSAQLKPGITTVSIHVIFDRHGQIGEIAGCPEQQFGLDFGKSDLQNGSHRKLFEEIVRSAYTDHAPIPMKVRGEFKSLDNGRTTVLDVWKILLPE